MVLTLGTVLVCGVAMVSMVPRLWWWSFSRPDRWAWDEMPLPVTRATVEDDAADDRWQLWMLQVVEGIDRSGLGHPLLEAIDNARNDPAHAFATDPMADDLERRARAIADETWSEQVWLTGCIDQGRLDVLCASLDQQRSRPDSERAPVVVRGNSSGSSRFAL